MASVGFNIRLVKLSMGSWFDRWVFHGFDAETIYRIPLSRRCVLDVLVWLHNKNGRYSVKSGYYVARRLLREASQVEWGKGQVRC